MNLRLGRMWSLAPVGGSMQRGICSGICHGVVVALLLALPQGKAVQAGEKPKSRQTAELVTFPGTSWGAVKVLRGRISAKDRDLPKPAAEKPEIAEVVTFGDGGRAPVRVVRGEADRPPGTAVQTHPTHGM